MELKRLKYLCTALDMNKREKIIRSAITLFSEDGIKATSTSKIAKNAEVSNGTLFHYFPTKGELVFETYAFIQDSLFKMNSEVILDHENPELYLRQFWYNGIVWAIQNPTYFKFNATFRCSKYILEIDMLEFESQRLYLRAVKHAIEIGKLKKMDPVFIYDLLASQGEAAVRYFMRNPKEITNEELQRDLFDSVWKSVKSN